MHHTVKIQSIEPLTNSVFLFKVDKPLDFAFIPGHSIMTSINSPLLKDKQIPLTPLSVNENAYLEFAIKNYPGKLTSEFLKLKPGNSIILKEKFGTTRYNGPGLFITGGIAIAPFMAIFHQLKKDNAIRGNKLIYSNKTASEIIFKDELISILGEENCIFSLTQEKNLSYGFGRINEDLLRHFINSKDIECYITGSEQFIADMKVLVDKIKSKF